MNSRIPRGYSAKYGSSPASNMVMSVFDRLGDALARPVYNTTVTNPRLADERTDALWRKAKPGIAVILTAVAYLFAVALFAAAVIDFEAVRTPASCLAEARRGTVSHTHSFEELHLHGELVSLDTCAASYLHFTDGHEAATKISRACRQITESELEGGVVVIDPHSAHGEDGEAWHAYATLAEVVAVNERLLRASPGLDFMSPKYWRAGPRDGCPLSAYEDDFNPCVVTVRVGIGAGHMLTLFNPVVIDALREPPHGHGAHGAGALPLPSAEGAGGADAAHTALAARKAARPGAKEVLLAEFSEPSEIFYPLRIAEPLYERVTVTAVDARACVAGDPSKVTHRLGHWKTGAVVQLAIAAACDSNFMKRGEYIDRDGVDEQDTYE